MEIPQTGKFIVVFSAEWCKPCKSYKTQVKMAEDLGVKIIRCDVDESPGIAGAFNVMSVPVTFLVRNSMVVTQWNGPQPWEVLKDAWDNVMEFEKK